VPVTPVERQISLRDGFRLALRVWTPSIIPRGTVVIAHGLGEHAGRYQQLARDLGDAGWEVHAADYRGHGRSGGARGTLPRAESIRDDIIESLGFARATAPAPIVLLGHSMGGAMAAWALAHAPDSADALVLSSPALRADLSVIQKLLMNTMRHIQPNMVVSNGLDPKYLSHDATVVAAYRSDPLVHDRVSPRLAHAIVTAGNVAREAAPRWTTPTLVLYAGDDRIVNPRGSAEFAATVPSSVVTLRRYDKLYHEIFNEPERAEPIRALVEWLGKRTVAPR
jgi:alpha-beta hydrolase superfamily lysophospholipase